ncbi:tRNA (adenine(58)-N(1))-methyltransferase catalytic subunit TRM61 [Mycena venus]|uniref:tRNA (adenine(58)-N(1))-methyltransferase catalytic subunit TRM61 n=1 Tax=Mycena venus TaxID=2733690 RepID=A0A8H6YUE0_9AGAR|nr:tRNA (adenine(58)-N(1))-methyltransferase catalytic subunit TRM61 [Mycena venus]
MWSTAREIAAGDTVIIWLTREVVQSLVVTPGKDFNSKFGNYRHSDFIGMPYGSKVGSRTGKGFIHVLRPTPELWTMALPHRTQILYIADISLIISYLDIRRDSRVIEAGTGSGSFSHSVARSIGPSGHLWSYEFHEARAKKAREEFAQHGMSDIVTLTHQNVCKDGFNLTDAADSVFLDLPAPWDAVEHAKQALRKDRTTRICCFSPCMEQVLRTVSALNDAGFSDITMYETLVRPHDVAHVPALQSVTEVADKLKKAEGVREIKRLRQIAAGQRSHENPHGEKRKRSEEGSEQEELPVAEAEDSGSGKRLKTDDEMDDGTPSQDADVSRNLDELSVHTVRAGASIPAPPAKISVSKAIPEVRGHTSYLTFATLLPPMPPAPPEDTASQVPETT